ncbi:MAG: hypothetical protein WC100_11725 [Sterolibacterium sp.]
MEPVQANTPLAARAFEFNQEAKRRREAEQKAAAKTENRNNEQHPNRVSFSQEAQIKLSEEKTRDVNRVNEVRVDNNIRAAEKYSQAISQEIKQAADAKAEDRQLRQQRDSDKRARVAEATRQRDLTIKQVKEADDSHRKAKADETERALAEQNRIAKDLQDRKTLAAFTRDVNNRIKETNGIAEKANTATAVKNVDENKRNTAKDIHNADANKANIARVQAKTAKAMKMYNGMGKLA